MKRLSTTFALYGLVVLGACASSSNLSPGKALPGIGLGAAGESVLLSWSEDVPLARQLRPRTNIRLLASYETEFGPVTNEVISQASVRAGFNGLKFDLPDTIQFPPKGPVCLRLANGRQPIPLRIATYSQSSEGFIYKEWSATAAVNSELATTRVQASTIARNIENFKNPDPDFVNWSRENNLSTDVDCGKVTGARTMPKPPTALNEGQRVTGAKQQCVALYSEVVGDTIFSDMDTVVTASQSSPKYRQLAEQLVSDLRFHLPGKVYFPGSGLAIDESTIDQLKAELRTGRVSEISVRLLLETYDACLKEATSRFARSHSDWLEMTSAKTIAQKKGPAQKLCRARFSRDSERQAKLLELQAVQTGIEQRVEQLEMIPVTPLPKQKALIPEACPAQY